MRCLVEIDYVNVYLINFLYTTSCKQGTVLAQLLSKFAVEGTIKEGEENLRVAFVLLMILMLGRKRERSNSFSG